MAKRRTRKQKEKARHQFIASWEPFSNKIRQSSATKGKPKKNTPKAIVKGQIFEHKKAKKLKNTKIKNANHSADYENLGTIKRELAKSLIIASLILSLEVMLYLRWQ